MMEELGELLGRLPDYLGGHMLLSVTALGVGLAVSIPLGILASRRPKLAEYLLGAAGILQTVPTLALLVLMVPLLGGKIGFAPAFVALTLYGILPVLANTVTGIRGVDPTLTEAALGLGMNWGQMLFRVELPLAAPVIISGIRTATVLIVGTATLATPVGGMSLGNYIFSGLEMNDMRATLFGCILAAGLAVLLDQLVRLLEVAARRKRLALGGIIGLLLVLAGGLYGPIARLFTPPPPVIVASAPFTEQHILSEVMTQKLQQAGFRVDQRQGMGETIQFLALRHNQIDCCVNYTGNVWATLMKRTDVADRQTTLEETKTFLRDEYGIDCLGSLGFENAYALAMRRERAEKLGIKTIGDLARHAPQFALAGDLQFFERPEWKRAQEQYGLKFRVLRPMDPTLMYSAVATGSVDVVCAYSSDGRVLHGNLKLLEDPQQAFPPYDAMLLLSSRAAGNVRLRESLMPLVQAVDVVKMREANLLVDVEKKSARQAAQALLGKLGQ